MRPGWVLTKVERQRRFRRRRGSTSDHSSGTEASSHSNQNTLAEGPDVKAANVFGVTTIKTEALSPPSFAESVPDTLECVSSPQPNLESKIHPTTLSLCEAGNLKGESEGVGNSDIEGINIDATLCNDDDDEDEIDVEDLEEDDDDDDVRGGEQDPPKSTMSHLVLREVDGTIVKHCGKLFDCQYHSVSLGESLLKEIVMCAAFGVPISPAGTVSAYRLMIERVTRVAKALNTFDQLPARVQKLLLRQNADLMVCLQAAIFFDDRNGGLTQIFSSMGKDDHSKGMEIIEHVRRAKQGKNQKECNMARIDYAMFNSIQDLNDQKLEGQFQRLLFRVAQVARKDPMLMKVLSLIVLFTSDNVDGLTKEEVEEVDRKRLELTGILYRFITNYYKFHQAVLFFSHMINCIGDLSELSNINMRRSFTSDAIKSFQFCCSLQNQPYHKILCSGKSKL